MARPKHSFPSASQILALADGQGRLEIRVTPGASADAVLLPASGAARGLLVRTTAPPEDGKANHAVLQLLARALDCPASTLKLLRGASSRSKLVQLPV